EDDAPPQDDREAARRAASPLNRSGASRRCAAVPGASVPSYVLMIFLPAGRFFTGPLPPGRFAARAFAAVILPPLLFFAICFVSVAWIARPGTAGRGPAGWATSIRRLCVRSPPTSCVRPCTRRRVPGS